MTVPGLALDGDDLAQLLSHYHQPGKDRQPRRPPWTWSARPAAEQAALARLIELWVASYNQVHAITPAELIPPCWPQHPALATELAVQLWLWYAAHLDPRTTPAIAGEYYLRHLPGFRTRLDRLLGVSPGECRRGEHPRTWRQDTDIQRNRYPHTNPGGDTLDTLADLHFGFPHRTNDTP
ncbi:hypothetical protein [Actinophytocola sp.]|uniref:hypothetical protein n=1 Tax=Actinophytocola sp. TaxID=1872138 RepID=UPI002D7E5432|nr:hypothetical protein [Actinophytocola sp.]HET9139274.1 hypothetical protein [Actinophytocola sp.]